MISAETVTRTLEELSVNSPAQAQAIVKQMSKEQPVILAYLLASGKNEGLDEDEAQTLLYAGIAVWQLMRQNPNGTRKIIEQELERAEKANETLLEKMESDSEGDFCSAAESVALNSPEPEVLRYITEELMEDEEDTSNNPPFSEEHLGAAFLCLKNVLDAFIAAQK